MATESYVDDALKSFALWCAYVVEGCSKSEGSEIFEELLYVILSTLYDNGYDKEDLDAVYNEKIKRVIEDEMEG